MKRTIDLEKVVWDTLYRKGIIHETESFIYDLIKVFKRQDVRIVLDLAYGSGRYLVPLLENGFKAYGLDFSEEAIKLATKLIKTKNLDAELTISSMFERLPYQDNFFDAVISIRALNHGTIEEIRKGIKEIERILKPDGLIFVTVRKKISKRKRLPFKKIAHRTYLPLEGDEKGIRHYFFNKKILKKEFSAFQVLKLKIIRGPERWEMYYHLLGKLIKSKSLIKG